ncbi:MAG: GbsR/MarR family transcriptional regulator [Anaerolineales bacterium]
MSANQNDNTTPLHPTIQNVHDSMMQGLGQLADYFGYNRVMGELYATLLLHPGAMSLDELKDRVHKSKASVSMNTRTLEFMGAVKEVWVREDNPSNRKYYEAENDLWKILSKMLGGREMKDIDLAIAVMQQSIEQIKADQPNMDEENAKLGEFYIERMSLLLDFFRFAKLLLGTILEKADELNVGKVSRVDIE